jgi:membrane-anchored glycerophosphoryl diester phosphodiesterase (GDPDase)
MSELEPPTADDKTPDLTPPTPRRARRPRRGRFTIGGCLSQTLSIWIKNFIPFTILTALVMSPFVAWSVWTFDEPLDMELELANSIDMLISTFLGYVVSAAVVYGVFQQLRGKHATIGDSIGRGLNALPRVIGASLLILLLLCAIFTPMVVVMVVSPGFGTFLYFVSLFLMMVMFLGLAVVIPVCIFEEIGPVEALKRSWSLTSGYKISIFLFLVILNLIEGVIGAVIGGFVGVATTGDSFDDSLTSTIFLTTLVLTVLFTSMQAVASTVIYHDLRQTKEGIDTEELASIFE